MTTPKPEPAPEPKQGSVDNSVFTASQAAYLSMEREREALRAEVERLRRLILQAGARENGLKADLQLATEELAAAKEEIAKLRVDLPYCTMPYHKELNKWYGDALKERDAARDDRDSNLKTHNTVMRELGQQLAAERAAREKAEAEVKRLEEWLADRILMTPEEIAALEANPLKPPDSRPNRNLRQYNISKPEPGR